MSSNAQHFATVVLSAFRSAGHYTDQEVGDAGGPSTTTMTTLRKVAGGETGMSAPRGDTLRKIDQAARWQTGSARALWESGAAPLADDPFVLDRIERERSRQTENDRDRWVQTLSDRILELEERVDLLESNQRPRLLEVAHDEEHTIESEQGHDEYP